MQKIYPSYIEADLVCLASPMYYWSISGLLKCAFERLFAVSECNSRLLIPKKECVLLMAGEFHYFEETAFWYKSVMKRIGWEDKGSVFCGGVFKPGAIAGNEKIGEAYQLGYQLS